MQNTDFLPENLSICQIFPGMGKGYLYILFSHTEIFHKILIFLVIYTDFVLDQSGRSALTHSLTHPGMSVWTLPPEPSV